MNSSMQPHEKIRRVTPKFDKREDFIFALSGSTVIGQKASITIQEERGFHFHTCFKMFKQLPMTKGCLKMRLNLLIDSSTAFHYGGNI